MMDVAAYINEYKRRQDIGKDATREICIFHILRDRISNELITIFFKSLMVDEVVGK